MKYLSLLIFLSMPSLGKTLSHEEWIEHFRTRDLNTQLELDRLKSINLNIKERLGRILPSLNLGLIVDTAIAGPVGIVGNLSNLVGFMLPSRWFQWDESKMYYLSQYYSYMAMRGNSILSAEEIFLTLKRSYKIDDTLKKQRKLIAPLVKSIELRERMGELPLGSFARVKSKYLEIENDITQYELIIKQLLLEMNQLILASNLGEIKSIHYRERRPKVEELNWEVDEVLEKSVEIKSFESLMIAAQYSKQARMWGFLNFSEEGFGLGYFARNSQSTLEIEYLKKKKIETELQLKASFKSLSFEEEYLKKQEEILELANEVSKKRIKEITENYKITGVLDADNLVETLNHFLKVEVMLISNYTHWDFLNAQKERFLLEGFYTNLDDNIPKRDMSKLKRYQRREDRLIEKEN